MQISSTITKDAHGTNTTSSMLQNGSLVSCEMELDGALDRARHFVHVNDRGEAKTHELYATDSLAIRPFEIWRTCLALSSNLMSPCVEVAGTVA